MERNLFGKLNGETEAKIPNMGQFSSPNIHQKPVSSIFFLLIQSIKCRLMTKSIPGPLP
jgi:hypothetical protein